MFIFQFEDDAKKIVSAALKAKAKQLASSEARRLGAKGWPRGLHHWGKFV